MAVTPRENAIGALMNIVANAYPWKLGPARRLKLWSDVPAASRPACFLFEGGQETYSWSETALPKRTIEVKLFVYLNAKDPSIAGAALLNGVMDALDAAFALSGGDRVLGRNTLNGTAYHCKIDGKALKDPGDLDGDALLIVPVKLILP
jgi:hypothetical protein